MVLTAALRNSQLFTLMHLRDLLQPQSEREREARIWHCRVQGNVQWRLFVVLCALNPAMTMIDNLDGNDTLEALVLCRRTVLQRARALMDGPAEVPLVERFDAIPSLSALLTTSLEALKVAEEELREQNEKLRAQRAAMEERTRYYRLLFQHAPAPAFVTDFYGTIQESNLAAAQLFRREANQLERKPLAALLLPDRRESFRRQLTLIASAVDGVRDWPLLMQRVGDLPITVHAAVTVVPNVGATKSGLLYWMLRIPTESA